MSEPTSEIVTKPNTRDWFLDPPKWIAWVGLLVLAVGIAYPAVRAYRNYAVLELTFRFEKAGMSDFHNGGYLPAKAFRDGVNPYSLEAREKYVMTRSAAPYSPVVFMLHLPFTYLSLSQADIAFFTCNVLMIGLIGWFCVSMTGRSLHPSWWIWVFAALVLSRPGHITLYTGYFTAMMVIGTLVAIHFADRRPILSGAGMVLASLKPTYILPLIVLMLCRRNFKATIYGVVFCAIGAGIGLGWLAVHSDIVAVVEGVKEGQAAFDDDPTEIPVNTWTRIDSLGVVSKNMQWKPGNDVYLGMMLLLLTVPGFAIWKVAKLESNRSAAGLTAMIVVMAMLTTIYHHSYDCLLITVAWFAVTVGGKRVCSDLETIECRALSILLFIPAVNYLSTMAFRDKFNIENPSLIWSVITSVNGVCLFVALLVLLNAAWRLSKGGEGGEVSSEAS